MEEKCAGSHLVYIDDHSYYNPMSNGRKVCWLTTCLYWMIIHIIVPCRIPCRMEENLLAHNLFILMIIHIIIPCRMEEKCAGSQLVYIDDHSYYNPMSNGRKVCWLTTSLYWWSFILIVPMSNGRISVLSHNLLILMSHSYYNPMSNGRKVCWFTTCLYWWSFIL